MTSPASRPVPQYNVVAPDISSFEMVLADLARTWEQDGPTLDEFLLEWEIVAMDENGEYIMPADGGLSLTDDDNRSTFDA